MRTTLELDDTVVAAARSLAQSRGISLGRAVSELALRGLRRDSLAEAGSATVVDVAYSPFPVLLVPDEHVVTDELVAAHRDD